MRSRSRNIATAPQPPGPRPAAAAGSAFAGPAAEQPAPAPTGRGNGSGQAGRDKAAPARPATRRLSQRALRNWRVRSRLLLLITIPTLTAVALGGIRIASSVQSALTYQRVLQVATLSSDITVLTQRLEDERDQAVYFIAMGLHGGRAAALYGAITQIPLAEKNEGAAESAVVLQRTGLTDQVVSAVLPQLQRIRDGSFSAQTRLEASSALAQLNNVLPELRAAALTGTTELPAAVMSQKYTEIIDDLLIVEEAAAQGSSDTTLAQTVRVLGLVSRMKEDASEQRAILTEGLIERNLGSAAQQSLITAESDQSASLIEFNLSATAAQRSLFNHLAAGQVASLAPQYEAQAIALQNQDHTLAHDPTTADDWYGAVTHVIDFQMGAVERNLVSDITNRANTLRDQAVTTGILTGLAVLVVLALALLFTVIVARSMVRPLRRLRAGALEVAGVRLPETVRQMSDGEGTDGPVEVDPIDVDSTDEIGEVARAFDQVHREAVRLASNEAALRGNVNAMFVNLSRRSQSLVERQIRLIDDLEQGEQDPERLGNLFQMDHLATRMRRNSENLLVLAGHDVSRRWTQAVALVDVLRAAVSEIEQYGRVTLNVQPGISVRGQAVNDVVHLLAELVENATSFSAADTPVNVAGHLLNSGGVLLDITDQGVGMGAEEMAHANWRLDNPPVVDVAVSRRMGLFVVARLAARHGIRVRLRPASMGGLTALVWLPDEAISHENATAGPPGRRAEGAAQAASLSTLGSSLADWPAPGAGDDRAATMQALNAARAPRFTPLRPDLGDTAAFSAVGSDSGPGSPAPPVPPARPAARDQGSNGGGDTNGTGEQPAADTGIMPAFGSAAAGPGGAGPGNGTFSNGPLGNGPAGGNGPGSRQGGDGPLANGPLSNGPLAGQPASREDAPGGGPLGGGPIGSTLSGASGGGQAGSDPLAGAGQGLRQRAEDLPAPSFGSETSQGGRDVIVPPAAGNGEENRLPIFESVESDWFRRGRHGADRSAPPSATPAGAGAGAGASSGAAASSRGAGASAGGNGGWTSPSDEGWRAAQVAHAPLSGGVTVAGLPKRVPKANLVPGGVGSAAPAAPAPSRSAAAARDRLSSFQRGIRQGRAAATDSPTDDGEEDSAR